MSIVGICLAGLAFIFLIAFNNRADYEAGIGWGIYATLYLLAFSIVVLVKVKKVKK